MRQEWEPEELPASWTLAGDDWRLVGNKSGPTRLGFALLLKFHAIEGRCAASMKQRSRSVVPHFSAR
jgi:hypothetical protein